MNRLLRWALRNGWRRGILQGNRPWLIAGGFALGLKAMRKLAGSEEKIVYSEVLQPGETLVIAHRHPS